MPRTAGVSSKTTGAVHTTQTQATDGGAVISFVPIGLRTSLTVTVFFSLMLNLQRSVEQLFNSQTAQRRLLAGVVALFRHRNVARTML